MTKVSKTLRVAIIALFCSLLFVNCGDYGSTESGNSQNIDYDLRGTWERNALDFWPSGQTVTTGYGKVVLGYNTITITGPVAHLKNFTRDTALKAYTEENKLYIKDIGEWQDPISYKKWEAEQVGPYPRDKMLTLKEEEEDVSAAETFKRTADY